MSVARGPERLHLTVYGQAAGAGSKTAEVVCRKGKVPVLDEHGNFILRYRHQSKKTEPWMEAVAKQARIAWAGLAPLDGALWLDLTCFETRPQAHLFADGRLRPDAPAYPHSTTTHDSGKLRRAIEDAITRDRNGRWAPVLVDDKRVVEAADRKRYCDQMHPDPCAILIVGTMLNQTALEAGLTTPAPEGQTALV